MFVWNTPWGMPVGTIVRKRLGPKESLYQILQVLSVPLLEEMSILRALQASDPESDLFNVGNQLILFAF